MFENLRKGLNDVVYRIISENSGNDIIGMNKFKHTDIMAGCVESFELDNGIVMRGKRQEVSSFLVV